MVIHKLIHIGSCLIFFFCGAVYPHVKQHVTGRIFDIGTNAPLHDVDIRCIAGNCSSTKTDSIGVFLLTGISSYPVTLELKYRGYQQKEVVISEPLDSVYQFSLERRVHQFGEVVVTATRQPLATLKSPSSVTIISRSTIQNSPEGSVGSMLTGVSGLFVRDYGGRNGIQSASLRGTYSEHTLVLVDGLRYNSFQNSQTDFGLLSSSNVDHIEVVKGGHSAVYGADAIGGVINIVTRKQPDSASVSAKASLGSSGFSAQEVRARGAGAGVGWDGMVRRERGDGRFEYRYDDGITSSTLRRQGADYDLLFVSTRFDYGFLSSLSTTAGIDFTDADRGSPGPVTSADAIGRARLGDRLIRTYFGLDWKASPVIDARISSSFIGTRQIYSDPLHLIQGIPLSSEHKNKTWLLNPEVRYSYAEKGSATAGVEISRASIASTDVNSATRWQRSAYLGVHQGIQLDMLVDDVIFYPSIRYDHFSSVQGDVSPKIGINVGMLQSPVVRLRSSYGKNFRVPTFNELHWKVGGNPQLRSERSYSLDLGVVVTAEVSGPLTVDIGVFDIRTKDRIVWAPGAAGIWSPRNISSVESQGVEAEARWSGFGGVVNLDVNSTWNDVRKRSEDYPGDPTKDRFIPYIPGHTVHLSMTLTSEPATFLIRHSWMSYRYTTDINDRSLPGNSVTDATLRVTLPTTWITTEVKIEATNIFSSSYTIIPLYPMPFREFKCTIGVEL